MWYSNGPIYIGQWKSDNWTDGEWYVLQEDGTYSLYKYIDGKRGDIISSGHTNV